jgi:hypothetical protein
MTLAIGQVDRALDLPAQWDELAADYFQTVEFLNHAERHNPCEQRYYTLVRDGGLEVGCIVYTLRMDLFTFLTIPSPLRMNVVGIPCSVSSSGIVGNQELLPELFEHLKRREKGLLLALNLESSPLISGVATGRTLPTVILANRFPSWACYLESLRADYRRRFRLLSRPFAGIQARQLECSRFDDEMYLQYRQVLGRSKAKLETLSHSFFRHLPDRFNLTAYYDRGDLLGWFISITYRDRFTFFLGGVDQEVNRRLNIYLNILYHVLRKGIEEGASSIDLGQTAEIPKTRLGGKAVERYMAGHHTNRLFNQFLILGKGILEYPVTAPETHVFKEAR